MFTKKQTTKYKFINAKGAIRSVFVVVLITSLFAPTSLMLSVMAKLDTTSKVMADDEIIFDGGSVFGGFGGDDFNDTSVVDLPNDVYTTPIAQPTFVTPTVIDNETSGASYSIATPSFGGGDYGSQASNNTITGILSGLGDQAYSNNGWSLDIFGGSMIRTADNNNSSQGGMTDIPFGAGDTSASLGSVPAETPFGSGDHNGAVPANTPFGAGDHSGVVPLDTPFGAGDHTTPVVAAAPVNDFPWPVLGLLALPLLRSSSSSVAPVIATPASIPSTPTPGCTAPTITSPLSANATLGTPFSYTIIATGDQPMTFNALGLPANLTFSSNTLSGSPQIAGVYNVTITASNSCGTDSKVLVITVPSINGCSLALPTITSVNAFSGTVGTPVSFTITTTNAATTSVANLPSGLSFSTTTSAITGTPNAAGTTNAAVAATNACGVATQVLAITINPNSGGGGGGGGGSVSGGGGGSPASNVTLLSGPSSLASASVFLSRTPFGGVYLSEVPYTGIGDVFEVIGYILLVITLSASLAYVSIYGRDLKKFFEILNEAKALAIEYVIFAKKYLKAVKAGKIKEEMAEVASKVDIIIRDDVLVLIELARKNGALLKEDAAEYILLASDQMLSLAKELLMQIIAAKKVAIKDDAFVLLNLSVVRTTIHESYMSLAPLYLRYVNEGKIEMREALLKKVSSLGMDTDLFIKTAMKSYEEMGENYNLEFVTA